MFCDNTYVPELTLNLCLWTPYKCRCVSNGLVHDEDRIRPEESLIEHNKSIVVTFHSSYESRRFSAPRNILSRFVFFFLQE